LQVGATGADASFYVNAGTGVGVGRSAPGASLDVYRPFPTGNALRVLWYQDGVTPIFLVKGNPAAALADFNTADAVVYVGKAVTLRSINAAGSINASGADYAEYFHQEILGALEKEELACLSQTGKAKECAQGEAIIGVVSTMSGYVGNDIFDQNHPDATARVGLVGQIPTRVSREGGPIKVGDHITVSSVAGVGAKATHAGMTVGTAMQSFDRNGVGTIMVLVNPSWYDPGK